MLREETLFGIVDKVKLSIETLQMFEPPEGYWVGISGGKDSDVILELVKMSGVKYTAHHSLTTIDKPETIYHLRRNLPEVEIISPEIPFLTKLETKGFPIRQGRWCCEHYKEGGGAGRCVVTGIRRQESPRRKHRQTFEHCLYGGMKKTGKTFVHCILDWTEAEVWEFHRERGLTHCVLYDQGESRVGCLFCPMAKESSKQKDLKNYPRYTALFVRAFERLYQRRKEAGAESVNRWSCGEEMFHWWITGKGSPPGSKDQLFRFDD